MERLRCKNSREKVKFNLNSIKTDKIFFSSSGKTVFAGGNACCFRKRMEIRLSFAATALFFRTDRGFLFFVVAAERGFHASHLCPELTWRTTGFGMEKLAEIELIWEPHLIGNLRDPQIGVDQKMFDMEDQDIIPVLNRRAAVEFPETPEKCCFGHFTHPGQFRQIQLFPGGIQFPEQQFKTLLRDILFAGNIQFVCHAPQDDFQ